MHLFPKKSTPNHGAFNIIVKLGISHFQQYQTTLMLKKLCHETSFEQLPIGYWI